MKPVTQELLRQAAAAFAFDRPVGEAERFGAGHINDTFAVWAADRSKRWILQRINTDTFTDPAGLMENVTGVTAYLRRQIIERGGDPDRETLNVIPTLDGKPYYTLAGYPAATLHETIARFHDTPNRYANFEKALAADIMGRAKDVGPEIAFIRAREADCRVLVDQLAAGVLPLRVTHNDTKLNNVLIDQETGKGICVIDLDTVMPGLSAYDFGDSIRFGANDCAEDEPDQSKVHFSLHLYKVFAEGYLAAAGSAMTEAERRSLPWGAKLMTLECGIRFLTDYLEGDHYFKISRPDQNLDRARTQFTLVAGMERAFDEMTRLALTL